jgi:hypothetical protein
VRRSHSLSTKWKVAIHEAGHAVVGHLTGTAIDHVTIVPGRGSAGHSKPVHSPESIAARKLWDEAVAIQRKLVWGRLGEGFKGKEGWLLRKGSRRRYWRWNGRTVRPSDDNCGTVTTHGTPAPEMARRIKALRKQANALWNAEAESMTRKDHVEDLMHTLGGPVADCVFFNAPFEAGRWHRLSLWEIRSQGMDEDRHGFAIGWTGNAGANGDFRRIREALQHIDNANWREAREFYRAKAEKLVRQHRTTIERVAKALMRRKTLSGAELAKLIEQRRGES